MGCRGILAAAVPAMMLHMQALAIGSNVRPDRFPKARACHPPRDPKDLSPRHLACTVQAEPVDPGSCRVRLQPPLAQAWTWELRRGLLAQSKPTHLQDGERLAAGGHVGLRAALCQHQQPQIAQPGQVLRLHQAL